jgi:hypothetical protein
MRDPHELSAPYALDPAYSATKRLPESAGSLYGGEGTGSGAPWHSFPGDLSAFLMARARARAFRDVCNVFHPGFFHSCHACVQFEAFFENLPESLSFYHSGEARMEINGCHAGTWPASAAPEVRTANLRPFPKAAKNRVLITLCTAGEPAFLRAGGIWKCSPDSQNWELPERTPFSGNSRFPYKEELPLFPVSAKTREGTLYDFQTELIGRIEVRGSDAPRLFQPGESIPEALADSGAAQEQPRAETGTSPSREVAFRYLRLVEGEPPEPQDVACELAVHPAAYRGAFACSDETATRIWMHAAYTLRLCMRDVTLDGLKRDRLPWVGDLYLSQEANAFSFAEHGLFRRTLLAFYHDHPDLSDFSGIFDYTLLWVAAAGRYVLFSGDGEGAQMLWPRARRVLRALGSHLGKEGFLQSEQARWIFLDWRELPKSGTLLAIQCLYLLALESAAVLASAAGQKKEAAALRMQAGSLRRRTAGRFWNPKESRFADAWTGRHSRHGSHHAQAFAALASIAPPTRLRQALAACGKDAASPEAATPYMRFFECLAWARSGQNDGMLRKVSDYWGGMLAQGATTFWEAYDPAQAGDQHYAFYSRPFGKSLCHAWSAGPMALYSSELFGLRPTSPGWKELTFSPSLGPLKWASVCVPTPQGDLRAEAEGTQARLVLPAGCALSAPAIRASSREREISLSLRKGRWLPR